MSARRLPRTCGCWGSRARTSWPAATPTRCTTTCAAGPVSVTTRVCSTSLLPRSATWKAGRKSRGGSSRPSGSGCWRRAANVEHGASNVDVGSEFVSAILNAFEANKRLADRAVEQVRDDKLHIALDVNTNSIAVIMKHVAGNLLSRWTDFLTTDGEKPWRDRDTEFVDSSAGRAELLEIWERGWLCL